MLHQELKAVFFRGDESQASELFNEMLRTSVRLGLFAAMEEEINSLCGAKCFPDPDPTSDVAGAQPEVLVSMKRRKKFKVRGSATKRTAK